MKHQFRLSNHLTSYYQIGLVDGHCLSIMVYYLTLMSEYNSKPEIPHTSACSWDRFKIPTAIDRLLKFSHFLMFSKMMKSKKSIWTHCDVNWSPKINLATAKPEIRHISACRWDKIEIPTHIPMFRCQVARLTWLAWILSDVRKSGKATVATYNRK